MTEVLALTVGLLIGLVGGRFFRSKAPIIAEDYKIEHFEKDGFPRLMLKIEDGNHRVTNLEFHPVHSHALSDSLLRESARALTPKGVN